MTESVKKPLRALLRAALRFYPREYGKYSILMKAYFPYLAPKPPAKRITTLNGGIRMELDLNEYVQAQLYLFGTFEPATVKALKGLVKPGDVALDIGANVGYISLELAKRVGKSGKIFAFEPDASNFAALKRNLELNPDCNIEPIPLAVSDSNEPLRLYKALFDFNNGAHSTLPSEKHSTEFAEIPATTIDDFIRARGIEKLDAIKIDIEGAEMRAIDGMKETLANFRPVVAMELCAEHQARAGYSTQDVMRRMTTAFQMRVFGIEGSGKLEPISLEQERREGNVVFVPSERLAEFKSRILAERQ
ncbi:MAG: FkbM family methyltransferase [Chloroherpetonaceae bacterium]|nr:FkbM family methyltransferase [Chloroherpetonaceae bacterium]MDW8438652.1 FkbM family methyltransferase [Chloroherpetonaceae bacterium]